MPRLLSLMVIGLVRARRGDPGAAEAIGEAFAAAEPRRSVDGLAPVAAARAEVAWLSGRPQDVGPVTDEAFAGVLALGWERDVGELGRWRRRAGIEEDVHLSGGPDAATLAGDHEEAARRWTALGCPYEAALALVDSDDTDALRLAHDALRALGARAAAAHVAKRLRARGVRDLPRGLTRAPAGTRRVSRRASWPCSTWSRRAPQRGHRREPGRLPKDGRPPRLGRAAEARRAHARRGRGHRPA